MDLAAALRSATETRAFEVGRGALERLPKVLERLGLGDRLVLVADENTYAAAGERLERLLRKEGAVLGETILYPREPALHAEYGYIVELRRLFEKSDSVPIAVGSGTINDLVKRAAWEVGRRYLSVGTAVSMDGYSSAGASVVKDGFKQTLECSAPIAVIGDLDVLASAPAKMTSAGYGDLFAKVVAGADWIIADELGIESIDPLAWRMVQEDLRSWIDRPAAARSGDLESFGRLYTGLSLTGFAMQAIHKSRPASGAEHQLSHIWEMENLEQDGITVLHGLKVAIGSLATCALYEMLIELDIGSVDIEARIKEWLSWEEEQQSIARLAGNSPYAHQMPIESQKKYISHNALRERLGLVNRRWGTLRRRLNAQLYPYVRMRDMLSQAGCPVTPEEIGLTRERAVRTILLAQKMRERYTVLDLVYELGLLEEWKNRIFDSKLYWR